MKNLLRFLSPPVGWILALTPVCAAALIIILNSDFIETVAGVVVGIVLYVISAYVLAALIIAFPKLRAGIKAFFNENQRVVSIKERLHDNKYTGMYLTDIPARVRISLYVSLSINLIYVAMKMTTGVMYSSYLFIAEAVFYFILGIVRFLILRNMRKDNDLRQEYKVYRFCGFLLFVLTVALGSIVTQMIRTGRGNEYPGYLIFVVATYAFIFLAHTVNDLIKYRKRGSPVLTSAKTISFVQALVAVYSLQIALFEAFGEDETLALTMNSIFGGILCMSMLGMSVFMVIRGFENLKRS